jgi:pimeloyl-ACP methyl ester carboxylesterase
VHGEDWGSMVAARMARRHPNEIAALQITMPFTMPHGEFAPAPEWEARLYDVTGYDHMQAQVPDALTIGMVDSPLGLAAWVLEKFSAWSDNDGTLNSAFELDSLVTNLHFYWLNSSIMSATRIYREVALEADDVIGPPRINVPTSLSVFPKEPFSSPREWLEDVYDIRGYTVHESGGHFAALEQPDAVLAEIREFFPSLLKGAEK